MRTGQSIDLPAVAPARLTVTASPTTTLRPFVGSVAIASPCSLPRSAISSEGDESAVTRAPVECPRRRAPRAGPRRIAGTSARTAATAESSQ